MFEYSDEEFEMKLMLLKNKQGEIESLSKWCLKRHRYHKNIVSIWLKVIRKVKIEYRLTLFYLAHEIILRSKQVNGKFVNEWATSIHKVIPYVRDDKIQSKILNVINIWREQVVYDFSYTDILTVLLNVPIQKLQLADPVQEFQVQKLAVAIRSCAKFEPIKELKIKTDLSLTNDEVIQNMFQARNETLDDWSINDTPASPPFDQTISVQKFPILNTITDKTRCLHYNVSVSKQQCRDINYRVVPDIPMPTLPSDMCTDIIKSSTNSITVINDTPTSPPYHEKLSHQYFPIVTSLTDRGIHVNYSLPVKKKQDEDEIMISQKTIPKTSGSDHKNLMSSTHSLHMNSSTISSDINHPKVSDIPLPPLPPLPLLPPLPPLPPLLPLPPLPPLPPSPPVVRTEAITKAPENNITITNDSPASPPYYEKLPHQHIVTNLTNVERCIDYSALDTKNQDKDERMIFRKIISGNSDLDHENLMSLTHFPPMDSSPVFPVIVHQASSNSPIPFTPLTFVMNDNFKSVELDSSDNDEKPTLNLDQMHPVQFIPPLPLTFDLDHPSAPDVDNQWDQSSQNWNNERFSFNENQRNIEQPQLIPLQQQHHPPKHWKYPNQWIKEQNCNFVHHQPPCQWPKRDPRDLLRKNCCLRGKRGNSSWINSHKNFNHDSWSSDIWNQGPYFPPKEERW